MSSADDLVKQATAHHLAGRAADAEAAYREALRIDPNHADAIHQLGVLLGQHGKLDQAIDCIGRAVALSPQTTRFSNNLGAFLRQAGRYEEAIVACRHAIELDPKSAEAYCNLGAALVQLDRFDEAIAAQRDAIRLNPALLPAHRNLAKALRAAERLDEALESFAEVVRLSPNVAEHHGDLGQTLRDAGRLPEAEASLRKALSLKAEDADLHNQLGTVLHARGNAADGIAEFRESIRLSPDNGAAWNNLGVALREQRDTTAALDACQRATALMPDSADAFTNLGVVLRDRGRPVEAIALQRKALSLRPDFAPAWSNLGAALTDAGQYEPALEAHRRAMALSPQTPSMHLNYGVTLGELGRHTDAVAAYRRSIQLDPNFGLAWNNLGGALKFIGNVDESADACRRAVELMPDSAEARNNLAECLKDQRRLDEAIDQFAQAVRLAPHAPSIHSNLVFTLMYHPASTRASLDAAARKWAALQADRITIQTRHVDDRDPHRRLRIGYVSPDFRHHAAASFLLPLLANHDSRNVEVFCYAGVKRPDELTQQLRSHSHSWRNTVGLNDDAFADLVREDRIDILVDLSLHMSENRLPVFARKPAPVAVSWLGYPGSAGLSAIDYRLTDPFLDPPLEPSITVDRPIYLPHSFWCYQPIIQTPPVSALPALAGGHVTFGCLNNFCKVTTPALQLFAAVMKRVEHSRLVLQAKPGRHRDATIAELEQLGVAPERVRFVGYMPSAQYFRTFHEIDISLDPTPYTGHTSALDALWMGVPVVSLAGETAVARGGRSILANLGRREWSADQPAEYVDIAVALAADLPALAQIRSSLREQLSSSVLMDGPAFARAMEAAFRQMWQEFLARERPVDARSASR